MLSKYTKLQDHYEQLNALVKTNDNEITNKAIKQSKMLEMPLLKHCLHNIIKKLCGYKFIDKIGEYFNFTNSRNINYYTKVVGIDCCMGFCIIIIIHE